MRLQSWSTSGFRNLAPFELKTPSQFVVFYGNNGQGKTNALESIYFLANLRGLHSRRHQHLIGWGQSACHLKASVYSGSLYQSVALSLEGGKKTVSLDGSHQHQLDDYFSAIQAIAFTPKDGEIVSSDPSFRRAWMDRAAFTRSPSHLGIVRDYRRCLGQKSALLKKDAVSTLLLDTLNEQLALMGAHLSERRAQIVQELLPYVRSIHDQLSDSAQRLTLRYETICRGDTLNERRDALLSHLDAIKGDERRRRMCLAGPQKDTLRIELDGKGARSFGSRGQIRTIVLALKLAELLASKERGEHPLFLLDDLSSELDHQRTCQLVGILRDLGNQVFLSTTDLSHLSNLPKFDSAMIQVNAGHLKVND